MFTIKFYRFSPEGTSTANIACPHYETFERESGSTTITVYKTHLQTDGVEYQVSDEAPKDYQSCYIENQAGKTISHYSVDKGMQSIGK